MKNKLTKNLGLKILSVVAAFLFWLVIINVTDPTTVKTFYGIPVQVLNENVITSANQVYEIESGDSVNITVKGKRSFIQSLSNNDFEATADLSELSKVNAVTVDVKLKKVTDSAYDLDAGSAVMKVKLEKRVTQKFKVEVESQGELSDNYELGEMTAKPNILEVSCGQSKFKKIDHVAVVVSLNGESEDFERSYTPVLYDKNGDIIDSSNVTFSSDSVLVYTQVLLTKKINVTVKTSGTPAAGYRLIQTDFKPESIRVTGEADLLKRQTEVTITIPINGEKKAVEREIEVDKYLPEGLQVVGENKTISVRCDIEKNGKRAFVLTTSDIAVKNLPSNCTMEFADNESKWQVAVSGREAVLKNLQLNDLGAYIDLKGMEAGEHLVDVQFTLPNGVKLKNKIKVSVVLGSQTLNTDGPTPTPEPTLQPSQTPEE